MARYLFTVAYDGASYSGWQIQKGSPSIQEELEGALQVFAGSPVRIHGSGRTDAGVHARGQTFHADLPDSLNISVESWPQALNTKLPHMIRVLCCRQVASDFHARFSALGKTYRYCLVTDRVLMPFKFGRAGHYPRKIDEGSFRETVSRFAGTHDFRKFAAVRGNEPDPLPEEYYIRTITEAFAERTPDGYVIQFSGNGFLYKMVRLMVGTALAVGEGKITSTEFDDMLHSPVGSKSRHCAVPQGLTLVSVRYDFTSY